MSTLRIENLANTAATSIIGTTTLVDRVANATARAWVKFNGTGTVTIQSSYNVSSITDIGVGAYRVNFTTPMPDANYVVVHSCVQIIATNGGVSIAPFLEAQTASSVRVQTYNTAFAGSDAETVSVAIFR